MEGAPGSQSGEDVFFLVGTGRCGTTLLQAMLSCHPRLFVPAETHFFATLDPAFAFHDPLREGDLEPYVRLSLSQPAFASGGIAASELWQALRAGKRGSRELFLWLLRRLAGAEGAGRRLGEKTPRHEQNVARIAALFPEARFVHLVRDPRDVVASLRSLGWRGSDSVAELARQCRRTYRRRERFAAELGPERYATLHYEKLLADPEGTLRRLCAFLGEDFDPAMLRYAERRQAGFFPEEAAWKARTFQPLDSARVGSFRTRLSPEEIRSVERALGRHLQGLGYVPLTPPPRTPVPWPARLRGAWQRRRPVARRARGAAGTAPRVSVAMPAYEREHTIAAAIESVLAQTFPDFELLVLDDGSRDATAAVAASYRDPRIRIVRSSCHRGLVQQRARSLELARGELIAHLDSDDLAHPRRLERQVAFLDAHPRCALVGSWARRIGPGGERLGRYRRPVRCEEIRARLLFENCFKNTTVIGRSAILREFGYRDVLVCEDVDLFVRIALVHEVANLPEVLGSYRKHQGSISTQERQRTREALQRIVAEQLERLGVRFAPEDLERDHLLRQLEGWRPDDDFLAWAKAWLAGLGRANERVRLYPEPYFGRELARRWRKVSRRAQRAPEAAPALESAS
jgi:glycosyltransferase involved in cell wall biosynthesis